MMTDEYIAAIQKVSPKVIRYSERRSMAKGDLSFNPYHHTDVLVNPYLKIVKRNKTQTFRDLSEDEVTLIFRAIYSMLVRPFIESNPIAGTRRHRRIVVENIARLLGK
jgi:hypothetical protein